MEQVNTVMTSPYFTAILTMCLILYASMVRPDLPNFVVALFEQWWFRFIFLFLIAFTATKNIQVAVIAALVFLMTMLFVSERKMAEGFATYKN